MNTNTEFVTDWQLDSYPSPESAYDADDLRHGTGRIVCPIECIEDLIRERAYQIYQSLGRQKGHDLDDWLEAEQEIQHELKLWEHYESSHPNEHLVPRREDEETGLPFNSTPFHLFLLGSIYGPTGGDTSRTSKQTRGMIPWLSERPN